MGRSVPETHQHVAGTLSNQPTNKHQNIFSVMKLLVCLDLEKQGLNLVSSAVEVDVLPLGQRGGHTEREAANQYYNHTQSQYTNTGPAKPSTDPLTHFAWQDGHQNTFSVIMLLVCLDLEKQGLILVSPRCRAGRLTTRPLRRNHMKLVARGFLRVLRFPPLLHRFNGSANKLKLK